MRPRPKIRRASACCVCALLAAPALLAQETGTEAAGGAADEPAPQAPAIELVWELDAYYSSLGLHVPLTDEPIPDAGTLDEFTIYRELFLRSLKPQIMLIEASVYPMPLLGTWLRRHERGFYDSGDFGDFNVIESVTAGFREPAAVSVFFGSAMNFTKPGERRRGTNKGYMGYLFSAGTKHIKDNVLIDDDWYEIEWKLKGEREFSDEDLSWSFRAGAKNHQNPDVADIVYVGIRRSNLEYKSPVLSFLKNSNLDFQLEFVRQTRAFARQQIIIGKKYPLRDRKLAFALDVGFIYETGRLYRGTLHDPDDNRFTFVIRPNVEF